MVNICYITQNAWRISVILINTTYHNILIRQTLLTVEVFEVEVEPQKYCMVMSQEKGDIINFQPVSPHGVNDQVNINTVEVADGRD